MAICLTLGLGIVPAWSFDEGFSANPLPSGPGPSFSSVLDGASFTFAFTADGDSGNFAYDASSGPDGSASIVAQSALPETMTVEKVTICRAAQASFVFAGLDVANYGSEPVTVGGYLAGSLVATTLSANGGEVVTLNFGGIVVDEVRITGTHIDINFDNFSGALAVPPTTTVDTAALSADTGLSGSDFITATAAQTISGTLSANLGVGESVEVSFNNGGSWVTAGSFSVGSTLWSTTTYLSGSGTFTARVTNAGGSSTAYAHAYVLDTTAPTSTIATLSFSADTGASHADFVTGTAAQSVSGTLSANLLVGETVLVSLDNGASYAAASATVGQLAWSLPGQTLTSSSTLKVKVTDLAGNDGAVRSQVYVLDTTPPATTVTAASLSVDTGISATDFITQMAAQTISGTLSANLLVGETVSVSLDNGGSWQAASAAAGQSIWSLSGQTLVSSDTLLVAVTDTAGNAGVVFSQAYVLDTTAPATSVATASFSADSGISATDFITQTAAQTISGTLTASLAVGEGVRVSLDNGGVWTPASATVGQSTWSLSGQTLTASSTLKVAVTDMAGNDGAVHAQAYVLDTTAPAVSAVTVSPGTYAAGQSIDLTVSLAEAVIVDSTGGMPRIALTVGATTRHASYQSGSGSSTLTFRYTVLTGDSDADGVALATSIDANGGTLRDVAGNDAVLTLNGVGSTGSVLVEGVAPIALSLLRSGGSPSNATTLGYVLVFSKDVNGVDATDFTLVASGTASGSIGSVTATDARTYAISIGSVTGVGTLRLDLASSGTGIVDLQGNALSGGLAGAVYAVDDAAPQVVGVTTPIAGTYGQGETLNFTVVFDEAVVVTGVPALALTIGGVARSATYVSGSGGTALVFGYAVQADDRDADGIDLAAGIGLAGGVLQDAAGNPAALALNGVGTTTGVLVDGRIQASQSNDGDNENDKAHCGMGAGSVLGLLAGLLLVGRLHRRRRLAWE